MNNESTGTLPYIKILEEMNIDHRKLSKECIKDLNDTDILCYRVGGRLVSKQAIGCILTRHHSDITANKYKISI